MKIIKFISFTQYNAKINLKAKFLYYQKLLRQLVKKHTIIILSHIFYQYYENTNKH